MPIPIKSSRTERERCIDMLLLLAGAQRAAERELRPGNTVWQKILFWAKMELYSLRKRGIAAPFVKWNYGPYSPELVKDEVLLRRAGLLDVLSFHPTSRGSDIAKHYTRLLAPSNPEVFEAIYRSLETRGNWTAARAKQEAYAAEYRYANGERVSLREVVKGTLLIPEHMEARPFIADPELVQDLALDLAIKPSDVEASKRFSQPGMMLEDFMAAECKP